MNDVALKDRLREDLTAAMRARDEVAKSTLRSVLTSISKAEVAGKSQSTLSDDQVIGVIRSELGKRREAAEIYEKAGRDELAARERAEIEVLSPYLPAELSDEELGAIVAEEVQAARDSGIDGPRAMGAVIKAVRERAGVRAEGSRIAQAVKAALAG
ncbi:MAG TPA: GatB/YqeY domain-containing protein [Actinomycetota bacterium]|nr:GatB/YqeY domain-containing protein [Actinomycetota bacterium]